MSGDIDDVKAYLDDAIRGAAAECETLESVGHHSTHGRTALETLQRVRKEIEWIEVEGYKPEPVGEPS